MIARNIIRPLDSAYLALQSVFWKTFKCPQHNEKSAKVFFPKNFSSENAKADFFLKKFGLESSKVVFV